MTEPMSIEFVVSNVGFSQDGIDIACMRLPHDVRGQGKLLATHSFALAEDHPDYADQVREIRELVGELVADLFNDFESSPIEEVADEDDNEDDERGMGE